MNIDYSKRQDRAIELMKEQGLDVWVTYVSEGSDPAVELLYGLKTIGRTAFILCADGRKISICANIDAQESEDSGYFDRVAAYSGEPAETIFSVLTELAPRNIALNYSRTDYLCDGLTAGRMKNLRAMIGPDLCSLICSSEPVLSRLWQEFSLSH